MGAKCNPFKIRWCHGTQGTHTNAPSALGAKAPILTRPLYCTIFGISESPNHLNFDWLLITNFVHFVA